MTSRRSSFRHVLERRGRWIDIAVLVLPVLVNVGVYVLPDATKRRLALEYDAPTLLSIFASSYVHFASEHLIGNLVAYAAGATLVYLLCVHSERRGLFYALTITSLLAFPFVLGALNIALVRPRLGYGFSGVVLSYFGFLPTSLSAYVHRTFDDDVGIRHSPLLFFAGAAFIGVLSLPTRTPQSTALVLIPGIAAIGYGYDLYTDLSTVSVESVQFTAFEEAGYVELGVSAIVIFACFLLVAFPIDPVKHGYVVNLYEHFLGYCFGYVVPFLTITLAGLLDYGRGLDVAPY